MKVKAEHWVNYNGTWYRPGEEYEVEPEQPAQPAGEEPEAEPQPAKRGRKRTTKE